MISWLINKHDGTVTKFAYGIQIEHAPTMTDWVTNPSVTGLISWFTDSKS